MATQYPSAQLVVGGQPTVPGYDVISATPGFQEDRESYANEDGTHKVDIVYSRRRTLALELQAQHGTNTNTFQAGGTLGVSGVTYCITSCSIAQTRGPTMVSLQLIDQEEGITLD